MWTLLLYFRRSVLGQAESMGEPGEVGTVKWDLALCLVLSWLVVFACLCKGVKSSGKVSVQLWQFYHHLLQLHSIFHKHMANLAHKAFNFQCA